MDRVLASVAAIAAVLLVAGCGASDTDPGPGGVTVGEARALDEAAEMLEERRLPAEALRSGQPAPDDDAETARP